MPGRYLRHNSRRWCRRLRLPYSSTCPLGTAYSWMPRSCPYLQNRYRRCSSGRWTPRTLPAPSSIFRPDIARSLPPWTCLSSSKTFRQGKPRMRPSSQRPMPTTRCRRRIPHSPRLHRFQRSSSMCPGCSLDNYLHCLSLGSMNVFLPGTRRRRLRRHCQQSSRTCRRHIECNVTKNPSRWS